MTRNSLTCIVYKIGLIQALQEMVVNRGNFFPRVIVHEFILDSIIRTIKPAMKTNLRTTI
jgi:hypothetical protein